MDRCSKVRTEFSRIPLIDLDENYEITVCPASVKKSNEEIENKHVHKFVLLDPVVGRFIEGYTSLTKSNSFDSFIYLL